MTSKFLTISVQFYLLFGNELLIRRTAKQIERFELKMNAGTPRPHQIGRLHHPL